MIAQVLNTRSEAQLDAEMLGHFLAHCDSNGKLVSLFPPTEWIKLCINLLHRTAECQLNLQFFLWNLFSGFVWPDLNMFWPPEQAVIVNENAFSINWSDQRNEWMKKWMGRWMDRWMVFSVVMEYKSPGKYFHHLFQSLLHVLQGIPFVFFFWDPVICWAPLLSSGFTSCTSSTSGLLWGTVVLKSWMIVAFSLICKSLHISSPDQWSVFLSFPLPSFCLSQN